MTDSKPDERGADLRRHERAAVTLLVEYDGAEDFVGDYTDNLSNGGTFVVTSRSLELGTVVRLVLSFPGLLEPIAVEGLVRWSKSEGEPGVGVEFQPGPSRDRLAGLVDRIRQADPRVVSRVVRVLVAEDNPHVAELIRDGLTRSARRDFSEGLTFVFTTAGSGRDAIEHLRAGQFDLAIVDVYLPVLDGAQVISTARGELGLADLPIIAVSAGGDSARASAMAAGANIFIDKPMRLRQVVETIQRLVKLGAGLPGGAGPSR